MAELQQVARDLPVYDEREDDDRSVNIVVQPGATVNVQAKNDSVPAIVRHSKTANRWALSRARS